MLSIHLGSTRSVFKPGRAGAFAVFLFIFLVGIMLRAAANQYYAYEIVAQSGQNGFTSTASRCTPMNAYQPS